MKKLVLIFLLLPIYIFAQNNFWSNNGAFVSIKDKAYLSVVGDMHNLRGGLYDNTDSIFLTGDWRNDAGNRAAGARKIPRRRRYERRRGERPAEHVLVAERRVQPGDDTDREAVEGEVLAALERAGDVVGAAEQIDVERAEDDEQPVHQRDQEADREDDGWELDGRVDQVHGRLPAQVMSGVVPQAQARSARAAAQVTPGRVILETRRAGRCGARGTTVGARRLTL